MSSRTMGGWAFIIGLILAVFLAFFGSGAEWPVYILLILGLIVGFMNVTGDETVPFLVASIAFLFTFAALAEIASSISLLGLGDTLVTFFVLINVFIGPAAAVVAFKTLLAHAKD